MSLMCQWLLKQYVHVPFVNLLKTGFRQKIVFFSAEVNILRKESESESENL